MDCLKLLSCARFLSTLVQIDLEDAKKHWGKPCSQSKDGTLVWGNWARKLRLPGVSDAAVEDLTTRFSLCCTLCRKRLTPNSVRFAGRSLDSSHFRPGSENGLKAPAGFVFESENAEKRLNASAEPELEPFLSRCSNKPVGERAPFFVAAKVKSEVAAMQTRGTLNIVWACRKDWVEAARDLRESLSIIGQKRTCSSRPASRPRGLDRSARRRARISC